jgi:transposase
LTPLVYASASRTRVGHITAKGDSGLRRLLVLGASTVVRFAKTRAPKTEPERWLQSVLARRPVKVATWPARPRPPVWLGRRWPRFQSIGFDRLECQRRGC